MDRQPLTPAEITAVTDAPTGEDQIQAIMKSRSLSYEQAYDVLADHFGASRFDERVVWPEERQP